MDPQLAQTAVLFLNQASVNLACSAIWDLVKLHMTKPEQQQAVRSVEQDSSKEHKWKILEGYLMEALEENTEFQEKLAKLLKEQKTNINQTAEVNGDGNEVYQIVGNGISILR